MVANSALPYRLHKEANDEIFAAALWYLDDSPDVASKFIQAIEKAIERIRQYPEIGHHHLDESRRYQVRPFPYSLIYLVRDGLIDIVACSHAKREPGYWSSRLDDI